MMSTRKLENFWDSAYRNGDHLEHWESLGPPEELVAALADGLVRPGQTALDIGCGAGSEALVLALAGVSVIGVDSSPVALELANRRAQEAGLTVDWRLGSAFELPLADNSVDFALDRGCLHVLPAPRWRLYVKQLRRVLRPGGSLLLRGAREDDEDLGLVGLGERRIARAFRPFGFEPGPVERFTMKARSGDLEANRVVLTKV